MTPLIKNQIADLKDRIINPLTIILGHAIKTNKKDDIKKQVKRIVDYLNELEKQTIK